MHIESLIVKKLDETFLHIECEPSTERELAEHFCFYVPGYKFMPAYRNRVWDGKIRLFNHRTKTLYCGLYKYLQEFAAERDYSIINDGSIVTSGNSKEIVNDDKAKQLYFGENFEI